MSRFRIFICLLLCVALLIPAMGSGQTEEPQKNSSNNDIIWIGIGVAGLVYLLTHHHRRSQEIPSPSPSGASPTPSESPQAHAPQSPPPIHRSEFCAPSMGDGYMQPTQGIWQDDRIFRYPFIIDREEAPYPLYETHYPLIVGRPSLIAGVYRYRIPSGTNYLEEDREVGDRKGGHIKLTLNTNCDPANGEQTRVEFTFYDNGAAIWKKDHSIAYKIPFYGSTRKDGETYGYDLSVSAPKGWPENGLAFTPTQPGRFVLMAHVQSLHNGYWQDVPGLLMSVHGSIVQTHGLLIHYIPIHLSAHEKVTFAEDSLQEAATGIATRVGLELPDLYPVKPSRSDSQSIFPWKVESDKDGNVADLSSDQHITHPENYMSKEIRELYPADWVFRPGMADYENAILASLSNDYSLAAILEKGERVVVVLSSADFRLIAAPRSAAFTTNAKMIVVPSWARYATVGHELAHTLPWESLQNPNVADADAVPWMHTECNLGYHNVEKKAEGLKFISFGIPEANRTVYVRHNGIMGPADVDPYIEQCTYRHLADVLSKKTPDPKVFVVRGFLGKNGERIAAQFTPFYTVNSSVDVSSSPLQPGSQQQTLHIVQRSASGAVVEDTSFVPQYLRPDDPRTALSGPLLTSFVIRVPFHQQTRRIDLADADRTLATRDLSKPTPVVNIIEPRVGESISQNSYLTLRWSVAPTASEAVYASVLDSTDGGRTYVTKQIEQQVDSARIKLVESGQHILRVVVSDGSQSSEASVPVSVH